MICCEDKRRRLLKPPATYSSAEPMSASGIATQLPPHSPSLCTAVTAPPPAPVDLVRQRAVRDSRRLFRLRCNWHARTLFRVRREGGTVGARVQSERRERVAALVILGGGHVEAEVAEGLLALRLAAVALAELHGIAIKGGAGGVEAAQGRAAAGSGGTKGGGGGRRGEGDQSQHGRALEHLHTGGHLWWWW